MQEPARGTTLLRILSASAPPFLYILPTTFSSFHRHQEGDQVVTPTMVQQVPIANSHAEKQSQDDSRLQKTDYTRWRLLDESGRQTWHYLTNDNEVKKWPQSVADKYHLGFPTV